MRTTKAARVASKRASKQPRDKIGRFTDERRYSDGLVGQKLEKE